mgnify:CR=1 FL=1
MFKGKEDLVKLKGFSSKPERLENIKVKAELININKELRDVTFNINMTATTDIEELEDIINNQLWIMEDAKNGFEQEWLCNRILHVEADVEYD